jgi:hypothetical protein
VGVGGGMDGICSTTNTSSSLLKLFKHRARPPFPPSTTMADDARSALFGGAASRNAGKANPYANVGGGPADAAGSASASAAPTSSSSSSSSSAAARSPGAKGDGGGEADDPNRSLLLAGGKKRPEPAAASAAAPDAVAAAAPQPGANPEGAMFEGDLDFDFQDLNLTTGAGGAGGAASGRGVGDAEDGSLDFAALDADLARFERDELVRDALQKGVDLRIYSKQVDMELRQMEMLSIADCA